MISDQTCVHLNIQADFIMFKPVIGCRLNGKVNKIAKRHIGCLVHDHFNAWLPHTSSTEKIAADKLMNAEVEFTVQNISTDRNVLSIKGKFEKFLSPSLQKNTMVRIIPDKPETSRKKKKKDNTSVVNAVSTAEEIRAEDVSLSTKKKKKHRKEVTEVSQDVTSDSQRELENNVTISTDVDEEQHLKPKKKHKKDKRKSMDGNETVVSGARNVDDSLASIASYEPLFTSTQTDDVNNNKEVNDKKHKKKKKKHKEIAEADGSNIRFVNSSENENVVNVDTDKGQSVKLIEDSSRIQETPRNRKRCHDDNKYTKLKNSVNKDLDLAVPSPVKKFKRQKKSEVDFDSSADFTESSKSGRKEKKKKKHKDKSK